MNMIWMMCFVLETGAVTCMPDKAEENITKEVCEGAVALSIQNWPYEREVLAGFCVSAVTTEEAQKRQ
ncbi:MAG: hypothetical protein ACYS8I_03480 [Planctomycetota bacterium]|jgi:hypothetical protein